MNNWNKLGKLYHPISIDNKLQSHASNPIPVNIKADVFRIFFNGRDKDNKSSVGYIDFDIVKQVQLSRSSSFVFSFGNENSFYSHGVSIGCVYNIYKNKYILFMGWQIPKNSHWRGDIGRLKLTNNKYLNISPSFPFIGTCSVDMVSLSYPWVCFHEGIYKMWYGSTISWTSSNKEMVHVINYATSINGNDWIKHGLAIPYEIGEAQAFSRPSVLIKNNEYHMWYSYRSGMGEKYRIGYSHSIDGINWKRKHENVGIVVSKNGWDSEMICYPYVFEHKSEIYMLYNGNGHGKSGFGLAKLNL
jgi:hypothetical protein